MKVNELICKSKLQEINQITDCQAIDACSGDRSWKELLTSNELIVLDMKLSVEIINAENEENEQVEKRKHFNVVFLRIKLIYFKSFSILLILFSLDWCSEAKAYIWWVYNSIFENTMWKWQTGGDH